MPGGGILAMSMLVLLLLVAWGIFVLCSHLVVPVGSPPTLQVRSATALTEQQLLPQEQRRFPPKSWNNSANKTHTIAPGSSNNNDAPQEAEVDGSSSGSSNHYRETNEENDVVDPFPPPLYGYQSLLEMKGRHQRFPSVPERVQVYMSNWYLPPCQHQPQQQRDPEKEDGFIHYSFVDNIDATTEGGASSSSGRLLLVREVETVTSFYRADDDDDEKNSYSKNSRRRQTFRLDSNTTLGRLHFIVREKMIPEHCDSEYCVDILKHWVPAVDRVVGLNTSTAVSPVLFQFSDEELSRAMSASTHELVPHPNVPHLKKSRLALLRLRRQQPQAPLLPINTYDCSVIPKPFLPTAVVSDEDIHGHLHPSKCVTFFNSSAPFVILFLMSDNLCVRVFLYVSSAKSFSN